MTALLIMFIIFVLLLLIILGFSYYAYRTAFYMRSACTEKDLYAMPSALAKDPMSESIEKSMKRMLEIPCEPVTITSHDGLQLFGRYYHTADGAPVQILFHGYKSNPYIDCSGGTYLARKLGHNVLVADQRAHGKSQGHTITFGISERRDCLSWVHYVCKRFGSDTSVILAGLSMGAATVLMSADLPLPANVKGIFADCPYASPKSIIKEVCQSIHLLPGILPSSVSLSPALIYPFVKLGARIYGHFDLEETDAVTAVSKTRIPILLIHGESDNFVPCSMSREIYAACASPATLVTVPDAGHGMSYLTAPEIYEQAVTTFIADILI